MSSRKVRAHSTSLARFVAACISALVELVAIVLGTLDDHLISPLHFVPNHNPQPIVDRLWSKSSLNDESDAPDSRKGLSLVSV